MAPQSHPPLPPFHASTVTGRRFKYEEEGEEEAPAARHKKGLGAAPRRRASSDCADTPAQEGAEGEGAEEGGGLLARRRAGGPLVSLRWYDARARVALQRVARWLQVPWPQLVACETMWAAQVT
jgi:hypothetical protein